VTSMPSLLTCLSNACPEKQGLVEALEINGARTTVAVGALIAGARH
jgi:hypothetical protein